MYAAIFERGRPGHKERILLEKKDSYDWVTRRGKEHW